MIEMRRPVATGEGDCSAEKAMQPRAGSEQRESKAGKKLPREIFEVAHKIARREWPEEIALTVQDIEAEYTVTERVRL
jgi:hypothetical protein